MTDLILQYLRNSKKLEQILREEKEKMFSEPKLVVKKRGGQSRKFKVSKRKKDKTQRWLQRGKKSNPATTAKGTEVQDG